MEQQRGRRKTFLTYVLALEYALEHPDEDVAVVDACPQSNVSEMLLGGNGKGEENLTQLRNNQVTIAGYIKRRYETSRFKRLGNEVEYFIQCATYNPKCPPTESVPCTADAASLRGIENLFKLIYGVSLKGQPNPSEDVFLVFNHSAKNNALPLPLVHSFVLNRSRSQRQNAATAFNSHANEIRNVASRVLKTRPFFVFGTTRSSF